MLINVRARQIHAKIVYYGTGLGGKTTNLRHIHARIPSPARGRLVSIATENERTLFFDFLPLDLGEVRGFRMRFHLYTVPGQTFYAISRKLILRDVDGLIFVVDSQRHRLFENLESMEDLAQNLAAQQVDLRQIPFIIQWNKRDVEAAVPVAELEELFNPFRAPSFESVAKDGKGVIETLKACCREILISIEARGAQDRQARSVRAHAFPQAE